MLKDFNGEFQCSHTEDVIDSKICKTIFCNYYCNIGTISILSSGFANDLSMQGIRGETYKSRNTF